jgi:hypothetical protein
MFWAGARVPRYLLLGQSDTPGSCDRVCRLVINDISRARDTLMILSRHNALMRLLRGGKTVRLKRYPVLQRVESRKRQLSACRGLATPFDMRRCPHPAVDEFDVTLQIGRRR